MIAVGSRVRCVSVRYPGDRIYLGFSGTVVEFLEPTFTKEGKPHKIIRENILVERESDGLRRWFGADELEERR